MKNIYLINIDDVYHYIDENKLSDDDIMQIIMGMDEETCKEIVEKSHDQYSDVFTLEEFEAEFNYDIDHVFNSDQYFIRLF